MYEVMQEFQADTEVKQSKFLAYVMPWSEIEARLEELKTEHPKARHYIVAWRKINEFEQVLEYSTDDGEPKGTAGRPVLNVLRGHELINSGVIIVRYFGGTKLGTGGMVRAYSEAAKVVLDTAEFKSFDVRKQLCVSVSYSLNQRFEHYIKEHQLRVVKSDFQSNAVIHELALTKDEEEALKNYEATEQIIQIVD